MDTPDTVTDSARIAWIQRRLEGITLLLLAIAGWVVLR